MGGLPKWRAAQDRYRQHWPTNRFIPGRESGMTRAQLRAAAEAAFRSPHVAVTKLPPVRHGGPRRRTSG
jgi:hypothetical protein